MKENKKMIGVSFLMSFIYKCCARSYYDDGHEAYEHQE